MKHTLVFLVASLIAGSVFANSYVRGHTRSDGTYVQGYTRSSPDQYRSNNLGSESNGGSQRDEYSSNSATNKSNPSYGWRDNDRDGVINSYDRKPESKKGW
jgi:hypothetical protein